MGRPSGRGVSASSLGVGAPAPTTSYQMARGRLLQAARQRAGRILSEDHPPQPTANYLEMSQGSGPSVADWTHAVSQGLGNLYRHAKVFAPEEQGGYQIQGLLPTGPSKKSPTGDDALMFESTPAQALAKDWGDDVWPQVRASAEAAPPVEGLRYPDAANLSEHLDNPFYEFFIRKGKIPSQAMMRSVIINAGDARKHGTTTGNIFRHEMGHIASPYRAPGGDDSTIPYDQALEMLAKRYPALGQPDARPILGRMAERLEHMARPSEIPANLNALRRLEYGLTGNPTLTPEERVRLLQNLAQVRPGQIGEPSMRTDASWGEDPLMQFGPNAGQRADGYNQLIESMQMILPNLKPERKRAVRDLFNKGASASDPNEQVHA